MDLLQIERILLIFICLVGLQEVLAATDATAISAAQDTTEVTYDVTEANPYPLASAVGSSALAGASITTAMSPEDTTISDGETMTKARPTFSAATTRVDSTANWNNSSYPAEGGGAGGGGEGGGGGGGGGGSSGAVRGDTTANSAKATTASMNSTGKQTASPTTTPTSASPILCYNCSGSACNNISNDNSSTCSSNSGICYIQYNTAAMAMTLACNSLYTASGTCMSNYASQAAKTSCEFCCKTNRCNSKTSMEIGQKCLQLLQSSATRHFSLSAILLAVITAMSLPSLMLHIISC